MGDAIRPFKSIERAGERRRILTTRGFYRLLNKVLGKLQISAHGLDLSQGQDGHIHITAKNGATTTDSYPFKVTAAGAGLVTVSEGYVQFTAGGNARRYPLIGTSSIRNPGLGVQNWQAPRLPVIGNAIVYLRCTVGAVLGNVNVAGVPITYLVGGECIGEVGIFAAPAPPGNSPVLIDYPAGVSQYSSFTIPIASVSAAGESVSVLAQYWRNNISAALDGGGNLFLAAA